jgi:hypothetical protein
LKHGAIAANIPVMMNRLSPRDQRRDRRPASLLSRQARPSRVAKWFNTASIRFRKDARNEERAMSDDLQEDLIQLRARVTALTILVEALWTKELESAEDPAAIGRRMIDDHFTTNEKIRQKAGDSTFALHVSEALTSILDRAVATAVLRKQSRRKP